MAGDDQLIDPGQQESPNSKLADRILSHLKSGDLIHATDFDSVADALRTGVVNIDDWKSWIERFLQKEETDA